MTNEPTVAKVAGDFIGVVVAIIAVVFTCVFFFPIMVVMGAVHGAVAAWQIVAHCYDRCGED